MSVSFAEPSFCVGMETVIPAWGYLHDRAKEPEMVTEEIILYVESNVEAEEQGPNKSGPSTRVAFISIPNFF